MTNVGELECVMNIWSLRQNPYANTNQIHMRDFILSQGIVTCPFGHIGQERNNVIDEVYNESKAGESERTSGSQDRKFIEEIKIGDTVIIPLKGIKECILAKITSKPIYAFNTGLFTTVTEKGIKVMDKGEIPFRPVGRRIEIIESCIIFKSKRFLGKHSLCHVNPDKFKVNQILNN
jgi:hypothetical protein